MKLDIPSPFAPPSGRTHDAVTLAMIREAVRPGVLRSQRRRASLRKWKLRAELGFLVTVGVLGTFCGALFVANETYHFVAYVVERMR